MPAIRCCRGERVQPQQISISVFSAGYDAGARNSSGCLLSAANSLNDEDKMKRTLVIPALLLLAASAVAQTTPAQTKNPISTALADILLGRKKNTVAAAEAMPADKFNYKPTAAPNIEQGKDPDSKDKLVAALEASFDFCADALAKMDDSKLAETTEGFGGKQVSRAWISLALAGTWADYYAETAMYLRLNGVLPPTGRNK
jgi:hypothetical protein